MTCALAAKSQLTAAGYDRRDQAIANRGGEASDA